MGMGMVPDEKISESGRFQGQVVYALLSEILETNGQGMVKKEGFLLRYVCIAGLGWERLGLSKLTRRPGLLTLRTDYLTGYRQKHKDAPPTAGYISLEYTSPASAGDGQEHHSRPILPVSTVSLPFLAP